MGRYISQTDIENVFGATNVRAWSNLDTNASTTNTTRVDAAIAFAEQLIDDRFRNSMYSLPLTANGTDSLRPVIDWAAKLAGVWLYSSRGFRQNDDSTEGNRILFHRREVEELMDLYLSGSRTLDCARRWNSDTTAPFMA